MASHWFADESKVSGFRMVAAVADHRQLANGRAAIRQLLMRGQSRIHFTKERDCRRGQILQAIEQTGIQCVLYDASAIRDVAMARQACLEAMVSDAAAVGAHRLIIERDEPCVAADRKILYAHSAKLGCLDDLLFELLRASQEPLLWIPDAIGWCWAKGGHWREKAQPLISDRRRVG